ncbi:DNA-binding protein [Massilia sp. GER05]|uniref:DNA-binding protein n=1 Tax=Massilia sp. GER05 TaxID=3394605 RepID=UPI003F859035
MGRQALVTLDHIKAAVAALQAEGRNVSSRAVREKLGNVGSMGTINKLLQQCAGDKVETPSSLRQLPPEVQYAILDFADHQANDVRQQIADELMQCKREMDDLAEANEQLTVMIDDLREQIVRAMSDKANIEGQVKQLAEELTGSRNEIAAERRAAEATRVELIKLQMRTEVLAPLESELRDARAECEAQRRTSARFEQAAAVLEAQRLALENHVQFLDRKAEDAQDTRQQLAEKLETMSMLLDREKDARAIAERELAVVSATQAERKVAGNTTRKGTDSKQHNNPLTQD